VHGISITGRSKCTHCNTQIKWFDLIPVVSWIALGGACRACKQKISPLYPGIELLTAVTFWLLVTLVPHAHLLAYGIFFSALIVTIRSDLETMLIPRAATLYLIPLGIICSALGLLPITLTDSLLGVAFGFTFLFIIARLFLWMYKREGLGQGDVELLACVGAFTGPIGVWATLLIGSLSGTLVGVIYLAFSGKNRATPIPFGPFLAGGALLYVLFADRFLSAVLPNFVLG